MNAETVKNYFASDFSCSLFSDLIPSRHMSERIAFVLVLPYRGAISGQLHLQREEEGNGWVILRSVTHVGSGYLSVDGSFHYFTDNGVEVLKYHEFVIDEPGYL
jgi:hypothetical protein